MSEQLQPKGALMGAVQDTTEQFFRDAELTHDDLDSVLAAVRHHFDATVEAERSTHS